MESSQVVGGAEECSSSESGWTMYLASPMHDDDEAEIEEEEEEEEEEEDDGVESNNDEDNHDPNGGGGEEEEEDCDSLASDASSGPPHRGLSHKNGCAGGDVMPKQDDGDEEANRVEDGIKKHSGYSWKKAHKGVGKKRDGGGATVSRMGEGGVASLSRSSN